MRIVTPLGIRFRDCARGTDHQRLVVLVRRSSSKASRCGSPANPSRHLRGFSRMPGAPFEYPTSLDHRSFSPPTALPFVVMVADRLGALSAGGFGVDAVAPLRAPAVDLDAEPAPLLDAFCLPRRRGCEPAASPRFARILWDRDADGPAAYARVRARSADRTRHRRRRTSRTRAGAGAGGRWLRAAAPRLAARAADSSRPFDRPGR